eukprot:3186028-Prymnesium_polylepis.1
MPPLHALRPSVACRRSRTVAVRRSVVAAPRSVAVVRHSVVAVRSVVVVHSVVAVRSIVAVQADLHLGQHGLVVVGAPPVVRGAQVVEVGGQVGALVHILGQQRRSAPGRAGGGGVRA